jgi:hypothetical protein
MSDNVNLSLARKSKQDEFYTQLSDIENEMFHYKDQFRDKVVYCNCDDPYESNFFKYFAINFNFLKLKKLIATSYVNSVIKSNMFDMEALQTNKHPYKIEITEVTDENKDGAVDLLDVELLIKNKKNILTVLQGDGDFRSAECIEILKESDIIVTNPPFSLFREYVIQLMEYNKNFLIIGNLNAITYKEIFKLIKNNKLWLGYNNGVKTYLVPDNYDQANTFTEENGRKYATMGNTGWYTNLDVVKHHENIDLYKKYLPDEYPKYDNYDAIEVSKVSEIPMDYKGVMGVLITFLDKYNPEQFKIIDINHHFFTMIEQGLPKPSQLRISGRNDPYARIIIQRIK